MYIDNVDELNSRYKSRVSYSYSTYRKVYIGASSRNGPPSARGAFFA